MRSLNPWPIFPSHLDPPIARSLSLQFILQGLIDSFSLLQHLREETADRLQESSLQEALCFISKELERFLLFSLENPFIQKSSLFDKLCFYSEILIQASHIQDAEILMILEEMRNALLSLKSKMIAWKRVRVCIDEALAQCFDLYNELQSVYHTIHQNCRKLFSSLSPFLKEARFDENVLIFLIENKDKLNANLGAKRVEELLQSFFPAGHSQLRAAIYEGYMRRGFTTFLSSIEPLINAIEWETPCIAKP
jgi:hypothetical protein